MFDDKKPRRRRSFITGFVIFILCAIVIVQGFLVMGWYRHNNLLTITAALALRTSDLSLDNTTYLETIKPTVEHLKKDIGICEGLFIKRLYPNNLDASWKNRINNAKVR